MSEYRELFDRAALDPDSAFVAELEGQLTAPAAGLAAARANRLADRGLRWGAVIVLAAAAAIAAAAIFLTSGGDSRVKTVPATKPTSTTAAPSVTTLPSTPASSVAPFPASFSPASVSFVSPTKGWLLGSCARDATCPRVGLATTDDRGKDWRSVNGPPVPFGEGDVGSVRSVRFANDRDGYVFGGDLWVTHDGAATWQRVTLPGADGSSTVVAVETSSGGTTFAVFTTGEGFRIASSPATTDDWQLDPLVIPYGAGPVPSIQLVLHGSAGYLLENDRGAIAGARLGGNGRWYEWRTPPGTDPWSTLLAASSETDLAAVVSMGIWSGPSTPTTRLWRSSDAGQGYRSEGPEVPIAAARPRRSPRRRPRRRWSRVRTRVEHRSWSPPSTVARRGARCGPARVRRGGPTSGFTTLDQGVVVLGHDDGTADLLMTLDGGHTWSAAG